MNKVFPINESNYEYGLRNTSDCAARRIKRPKYLGPKLCNILPDVHKQIQSVKNFIAKIRS